MGEAEAELVGAAIDVAVLLVVVGVIERAIEGVGEMESEQLAEAEMGQGEIAGLGIVIEGLGERGEEAVIEGPLVGKGEVLGDVVFAIEAGVVVGNLGEIVGEGKLLAFGGIPLAGEREIVFMEFVDGGTIELGLGGVGMGDGEGGGDDGDAPVEVVP